jgi:hypothetical protein
MLSNYQIGNRALLQSFLVGQPELRDLMRSSSMTQLRQRVIAAYHLGPLDADETRAYIEHRLKQVGWKGDPQFEDGVFPVVHRYTGGIPRRVNTLCTRALLGAYLSERHVITVNELEAVIAEFSEEFGEAVSALPTADARAALADVVDDAAPASVLEKRILSMEKAMNITLRLLRELIRGRQGSEARWADKR